MAEIATVREKKKEQRDLRNIEKHLRNYHQYKIGIKNLKLQLDTIMPRMTATYELREGSSGSFTISSETERYAIDRIESKKALDLHETMNMYGIIVECIDSALEGLEDEEKKFVEYRYFSNFSVKKMALTLGYGESTIFCIRQKVLDKLFHSLNGLKVL